MTKERERGGVVSLTIVESGQIAGVAGQIGMIHALALGYHCDGFAQLVLGFGVFVHRFMNQRQARERVCVYGMLRAKPLCRDIPSLLKTGARVREISTLALGFP